MSSSAFDDLPDQQERRKFVLSFCYTFFAVGAYVVCRSAANAVFLARIGPSSLPVMYLVSACVVGGLALLSMRFAAKRSLKRVMISNLVMLAAFSVALCRFVEEYGSDLYLLGSIYLLAEVAGCLLTIQHGILVNEMFADSPRHHYITGWLGGAATLAGITFGTAIAFEVQLIGTLQLLYVAAALECLAMIPIMLLPRMNAKTETAVKKSQVVESRFDPDPVDAMQPDSGLATLTFGENPVAAKARDIVKAVRMPYVTCIAVIVAAAVVVSTLVEFEWKLAVSAALTDETEIARYFGIFQATVNLVTGACQLLLTGYVLKRLGARLSLLIFPSALVLAVLGSLTAAADRSAVLIALTLAKGCDALKRSFHDPTILTLYAPLGNGQRRQAITLVAGIVKPCAEAAAALLIVSLTSIGLANCILAATLGFLGVWFYVAINHIHFDTLSHS